MKRHDENNEGVGALMFMIGALLALIAVGIIFLIVHYVGG